MRILIHYSTVPWSARCGGRGPGPDDPLADSVHSISKQVNCWAIISESMKKNPRIHTATNSGPHWCENDSRWATCSLNIAHYTRPSHSLTQSLSYMMTVSAVVRLIPRPPARVLMRNTNTSSSVLNWRIWVVGMVYEWVGEYAYSINKRCTSDIRQCMHDECTVNFSKQWICDDLTVVVMRYTNVNFPNISSEICL